MGEIMVKDDKKKGPKKGNEDSSGATAQIKGVVEKLESKIKAVKPKKRSAKIREQLKKKEKEKIVEATMLKHYEKEELKIYQAELIKMQKHLENTGKKMIILFEGRDASGKGGTIRRIARYLNEKHYRVVALGKPSTEQKTELHIKRYVEQFPHAGEIVLFDRSWYNRSMVEPVMGFCTPKQYRQFMNKVVSYEQNFISGGDTIFIKLYFSVTKEEQKRRFDRRMNDPLRQWKLSEVDLQAQDLWREFSEKKFRLLEKTHTAKTPWYIIRSDDKHKARRETMKLILNLVKYKGRRRSLNFTPDPKIVIPGNKELKLMRKERKKYGKFIS
jgi:polyphosphate kinase 2